MGFHQPHFSRIPARIPARILRHIMPGCGCAIFVKRSVKRSVPPENEIRQKDEASKGEMAAIYRDRIPREKALEVLARGGKLSQADYLRCKVRYFSDGAVLGGK